MRRKLYKTGHLAIRHFYNIIFRLLLRILPYLYSQIQTSVPQEKAYVFRINLHRLNVGKHFFHKKAVYKFLMKILHLAFTLIKHHMIAPQCRKNLFFIDAYTVFQLTVHRIRNLPNQIMSFLHSHVFTLTSRCYRFMFRHTNLIKLFKIRRINSYEIDSFEQRKRIIICLQQYAMIK